MKPEELAQLQGSLAIERTFLAWVRTGLSMMGFGFVVARFGLFLREIAFSHQQVPPTPGLSKWLGTALVTLGIIVNLSAAIDYVRSIRRIARPGLVTSTSRMGVVVSVILAAIGAAMVMYLLQL